MADKKIRVAQIRGNGLSDRETKTWEYFPSDIEQTVFWAHKNVYAQTPLPYPTIKLRASSDNFFTKNAYKYLFGQYQHFFGLEKHLGSFDVVHAGELYNYYTYQAVQAKQKFPNLKVVATVWENIFGRFEYNYWPGFKMPPRYWRDRIHAIMQGNAAGVDAFLATSHDSAELLVDSGAPANKVHVVVPGIIPAVSATPVALPALLNGKERYLMVNRLVKEKGVYDVLYAWRRYLAKTAHPENKILVVVSDGPERANLMRLVQDWNFADKVFFIRQLPYAQMLSLYQGARCLLLGSMPTPTWQEQFGYVLAEAICASVPIIATSSGAIPEVVGAAGIIVPPAHPIAMSNALLALDAPEKYQTLVQGCATEKQKFAVQTYCNRVAEIYRSLV